jgi:hypothetical protein
MTVRRRSWIGRSRAGFKSLRHRGGEKSLDLFSRNELGADGEGTAEQPTLQQAVDGIVVHPKNLSRLPHGVGKSRHLPLFIEFAQHPGYLWRRRGCRGCERLTEQFQQDGLVQHKLSGEVYGDGFGGFCGLRAHGRQHTAASAHPQVLPATTRRRTLARQT